jgi:hypothetical protein
MAVEGAAVPQSRLCDLPSSPGDLGLRNPKSIVGLGSVYCREYTDADAVPLADTSQKAASLLRGPRAAIERKPFQLARGNDYPGEGSRNWTLLTQKTKNHVFDQLLFLLDQFKDFFEEKLLGCPLSASELLFTNQWLSVHARRTGGPAPKSQTGVPADLVTRCADHISNGFHDVGVGSHYPLHIANHRHGDFTLLIGEFLGIHAASP